ncbi:MAG TPA: glycoside hydrolase family 32 protein [Hanamia sp.]|nr:glycoside hydrolase family 32 protein [Hanamia sp.]
MKIIFSLFFMLFISITNAQETYHEPYRPQIHFSPRAHWMNDPNGMVYYKGVYHLFFQYYPGGTVWGPMHWGHATSKDLIHWQQQPIALYPDSLGYIFSGSAVVDKNNTSGFGRNGKIPLVAIYTNHDPKGAKAGTNNYQNQSIAYSLDNGKTWIKYSKNPVLKNPGITDFRDPKVMWYEPDKKWIMTLATKDRITFYSSPDLKNWEKESEFGEEAGAHGGVWECPDLFTLNDNSKKVWILIVNINPGGPNGGSATQYFVGKFNGKKFVADNETIKWLDYGPDEYAGVTWNNTGDRRIFLGWMSNWLYANVVPTIKWRNAMTIPCELKLKHVGKELLVTSEPVKELSLIEEKPIIDKNILVNKDFDVAQKIKKVSFPCRLNLSMDSTEDFSVILSNDIGEQVVIGYDKSNNRYYIDRTKSGKVDFQKDFAEVHTAPRFTENPKMNLSLVIDVSSVELFADNGLTVMTEIFFPNKPYDKISIHSNNKTKIKSLEYIKLKSIWK